MRICFVIFLVVFLPYFLKAQNPIYDTVLGYSGSSKYIKSITITKANKKHIRLYHSNSKLQVEYFTLDDKYEGKYIVYNADGVLASITNYKQGVFNGEKINYNADGSIKDKSHYKLVQINDVPKSVLDGTFVSYFNNGKKEKEINYKNGKKHGLESEWYAGGKKRTEINYRNGYKMGSFSFWYESGIQGSVGEYDTLQEKSSSKKLITREVKTGKWQEWNKNGTLIKQNNYLAGKENGKQEGWFENGQKSFESNMFNNLPKGQLIRYHNNGKLNVKYNQYSTEYDKSPYRYYYDGSYEEYDMNGVPKTIGSYVNGLKTGKWLQYYNGKISEESEYLKGRFINKHIAYYPNGKLQLSENYKSFTVNGKDTTLLDGPYFRYYDDGSIHIQCVYIEGKAVDNTNQSFYKNGAPQEEYKTEGDVVIKYEYNTNKKIKREWRAKKAQNVADKDLKYYLYKAYDDAGTLRRLSNNRNGKASDYFAEWNDDSTLVGEAYLFNFKGDYVNLGNIDNSWNAMYYYNGMPWKEIYIKTSWGIGYEIEWFINGKLKRVLHQGQFDLQWLQNGELMSAIYFDSKRYGEKKDTVLSKIWIQSIYDSYSKSKQKMLKLSNAPDGWQQSYYDDTHVRFETKVVNGKMDSVFNGYFSDGSLFVNWNLKNGVPHGKYTLMNANKTLYETGYFYNGKACGEWKVNSMTGVPYEQYEIDTIDNNKGYKYLYRKEFYPNGNVKNFYHYKNGKHNGKQQSWAENGQLISDYTMRNDSLIGDYKTWSEKGTPLRFTSYNEKGKKNGLEEAWFNNGKKNFEMNYVNNKKEGDTKTWWNNGKLRFKGQYENDQAAGKWIIYDSLGVKQKENNYSNGIAEKKISKNQCECYEPERKIGFAPMLQHLLDDTTHFTKWQFAYHEKLTGLKNDFFYMDFQNSSSRNSYFNGLTLISYKSIEVGFPDKNGIKVIFNPCVIGAGAPSQIHVNANTESKNPSATRIEISCNKMAFKFDTKLLQPVEKEIKECRAYFKMKYLNYELKGITLYGAESDCFVPSMIGKTGIKLMLNTFTPHITNKNISVFEPDDFYTSEIVKLIDEKYTGITDGAGTVSFKYGNAILDLPVKNIVCDNKLISGAITINDVKASNDSYSFKSKETTLTVTKTELSNWFTKQGIVKTQIDFNKEKNVLLIKFLYKR